MQFRALLLAAATMTAAAPAAATVYGVFGDSASQSVSLIQSRGDTASILPDLSAASLAGINVLWVLNGDNGRQPAALYSSAGSVASFVSGGGTFAYHDLETKSAAPTVPGAAAVGFTQVASHDINVILNGTVLTNGPGGVIDNTTLDGGNTQASGYAALNTLPAGTMALLSSTDATQVVAFSYAQGAGHVYYSSIPLSFFLGYPTDNVTKIYGPNMIAYVDQLSATPISEPASMGLLCAGLLGLGLVRRRG